MTVHHQITSGEIAPVMRLGNTRFSSTARAAGKGSFAAEAERLGLGWSQEDLETVTVDTPAAARELLGEDRAFVKRRECSSLGYPINSRTAIFR